MFMSLFFFLRNFVILGVTEKNSNTRIENPALYGLWFSTLFDLILDKYFVFVFSWIIFCMHGIHYAWLIIRHQN